MTTASEAAREYAAMQDDCEQLALANAGLLVEVAELTATVEAVRAVRLGIVATINNCGWGWADRVRSAVLCRVLRLLDQVEGL